MEEPSFSPALFAFLRDLADHNDREWFAANRDRYEAEVLEPSLAFVEDVAHRLPAVSRHFLAEARRSGGSLFRIHRDVRFSRDKSPYKTHTGIQFRHAAGKDAHAPGFYLHLEPGSVFFGCGAWQPPSGPLRAVRDRIAARPGEWREVVGDPVFAERFELGGESLKRPPQGFPADHPLIADLKRKSFIAMAPLSEAAAVAPGFLDDFMALAHVSAPFMRFLCDAVGAEF